MTPSSMLSVTLANAKSAAVIGYSTAPKQLWPVIIGTQNKGWLFHAGGGISGGTVCKVAATAVCTRPIPRANPCDDRAVGKTSPADAGP
eukprot:CAMPEP_0170321462 /NCGR_PEP_ID=MMETSP0116_2-20130129/61492_1 /TAXON_ID=400756 /ORGANISM="Durinskia baltica, Strain CSIRO CS-38" /LENGTH=88 /DNA_ID=CAMNT_0010574287 /DNA_START=59 /DNA_END=325 /DNA_ORIENTATION=-